MLKLTIIGNIGADAQIKGEAGNLFASFRVAHNSKWTDTQGVCHNDVIWVDVTTNHDSKVVPFLKAGQLVYVEGTMSLRVYSSEKERCMKAGASIRAQRIELLGGSSDPVPARLYGKTGVMYDVHKYYWSKSQESLLLDTRGRMFACDDNGLIMPYEQAPEEVQQRLAQLAAGNDAQQASDQQAAAQPQA